MKRYALFLLGMLVIFSMLLSACQAAGTNTATQAPAGEETAGYPGYPPAAEGEAAPSEGYPAQGETATLRVGTDATFPPFELVDEATQELTGFDVELMRAVAEQAGWNIEFVNQPFDPMLIALEQCQYDMGIAAITITDERKEKMLFSEPYINAGQIVVVRAGTTDIASKDDLVGMTIGAQLGTTGAIEAEKIEGITFKPYDTYDLAFLDLANGQIDAVIADYPLALDYIGQNPDKMQTVGEPFTDEFYGIAVCKNRSDLLEPLNQALQTLKDNGTVAQLEEKWLVRKGE